MTDAFRMTTFVATAAAFVCCAAPAHAKLVPNDRVAIDSSAVTEDAVVYVGPVGAAIAPGYVRVTPAKRPSPMCRMELFFAARPFRLARSCE